jgi:NTP pyrophosphatase (non-canonical NTP hydrolase)
MTFNEYRQLARRTRASEHTFQERLFNWSLSLVEEAGETAGVVKKFLFHGHNSEWARLKVVDELGDLLWYADALMEELGISWEEVLEGNIAKLKKRYPDGFSSEASQNREKDK